MGQSFEGIMEILSEQYANVHSSQNIVDDDGSIWEFKLLKKRHKAVKIIDKQNPEMPLLL